MPIDADDVSQLPPQVVTALLGLVKAVQTCLPTPPACAGCAALQEADAVLAAVQRPMPRPRKTPSGPCRTDLDAEIQAEVQAVLTVLQLFHPVAATPLQIADEVDLNGATVQMMLRGLAVRGMIEHPRRGYYRSWHGIEEDAPGQGGRP